MLDSNFTYVAAVLPVKDHAAAVAWYEKWIGGAPDVTTAEGVAEWQIAANAWIQVSVDPEPAGKTTVVIGVRDLEAQCRACAAVGISTGEINDYGVVKTAEIVDPDGNKVVFAQIVE